MKNEYKPDWVVPPGETIREILVEECANRMELTVDQAEDLLCGKLEITEQIAEKLSIEYGSTKTFWMNLERNYRESKE